ncbi:SAF domain-containing protein [Bosea vestrisii]|uniref:SAF domain-containing protein n=1 Tax=Bosea vestrisii TaxID=151416 RepID=UPI0032630370
MSPARIIILAVAVVAGLGAALLIGRPPKVTTPSETRYEPAPTVEVLVAAVDVPLGNKLAASDLKWLAWPLASLPPAVIRRQDLPGGERVRRPDRPRAALQLGAGPSREAA